MTQGHYFTSSDSEIVHFSPINTAKEEKCQTPFSTCCANRTGGTIFEKTY